MYPRYFWNMAERHIRVGATALAVQTPYERLRPSCTSVLQALIFAHLQNLLYTQKTTPDWVWSFSFIFLKNGYTKNAGVAVLRY